MGHLVRGRAESVGRRRFPRGIAAGLVSYDGFPSLWLSIFVVAMASYAATGEVRTRPRKLEQALYIGLPVLGAAIVYGAYLLTQRIWLAVLLGFVGSAILRSGLFFRRERSFERTVLLVPALALFVLSAVGALAIGASLLLLVALALLIGWRARPRGTGSIEGR